MTTREQLQQTLCDRLFWHTVERDDAIVAKHLFDHHEMDVVYAMDEAILFHSFSKHLQSKPYFGFKCRLGTTTYCEIGGGFYESQPIKNCRE